MKEKTIEERLAKLECLAKAIQNISWWISSNGYPDEEEFFIIMSYLADPESHSYIDDLNKSRAREKRYY
jgi:hypothetical protein